ncbi:Ribonuclease Z [Spatholobus suberectus]|nr:Ribonuclease Z [Spatholobus suberectus]
MEVKETTFNKRRAKGRDKNVILGTGMDTQDTSPSVLLFFDNQRFIFNAEEGLQRFCTEYKIKLSKIDHLFLSRVCFETAGGLPSLLLTLASMGEEGMPYLLLCISVIHGFICVLNHCSTHDCGLQKIVDCKPVFCYVMN